MTEQQFTQFLEQYSKALSSRNEFAVLLKYILPDMHLETNLLLNLYDLGIHTGIENAEQIDTSFMNSYLNRFCDEYGVTKENAKWAVDIWCKSYGSAILCKPCGILDKNVSATPFDSTNGKLIGNTFGNIFNMGAIAVNSDWLYFRNHNDRGKLYKAPKNESISYKICDDVVIYINSYKNFIIYVNSNDYCMYSIQSDGNNKRKICNDICKMFVVVGNWIFYVNESDCCCLYKISIDGSRRQKLNSDSSNFMNIIDNWVYYRNDSDNCKIYKASIDGKKRLKIDDDYCNCLIAEHGWIYFRNTSDGDKLYKLRLDGSGKQKINDNKCGDFNLANDWLYYSNDDDNGSLYRMHVNADKSEKLCDDHKCVCITVFNEWVFYIARSLSKGYRIRFDGTEHQEFYIITQNEGQGYGVVNNVNPPSINPNYEMSLEELDLTVRSFNALHRSGIRTVEDLANMTEYEMLKIRNLGSKSLEETKEKMLELGIVEWVDGSPIRIYNKPSTTVSSTRTGSVNKDNRIERQYKPETIGQSQSQKQTESANTLSVEIDMGRVEKRREELTQTAEMLNPENADDIAESIEDTEIIEELPYELLKLRTCHCRVKSRGLANMENVFRRSSQGSSILTGILILTKCRGNWVLKQFAIEYRRLRIW